MLPPPTVPTRSANSSEAGSMGPTPASSSSSSALPTTATIAHDFMDTSTPAIAPEWTERTLVHSGVFAGRHMKFYLDVAQQPIHGRRKTEKDRRPLAHCPILRLRLKECKRVTGTSLRSSLGREPGWEEEDVDVTSVESSNFICAADLISPQDTPSGSPFIQNTSTSIPGDGRTDGGQDGSNRLPSASSSEQTPRASPDMAYHRRPAPMSTNSSRSVDGDVTMGDRTERSYLKPNNDVPASSWSAHRVHPPHHSESSPNVLVTARDAPTRLPEGTDELHDVQEAKEERSARMFGRNLYGNSHVSGIRVPAPEGGVGLWFLFTDVSVRHEGEYTLRFRCFDITSVPSEGSMPSPPLVSAESQTFKVYSPRNFPGIPRPTELAEHFNRLGFKLNTRKNERIAENLPAPASSSASTSASTTSIRRPSPQPVQHHGRRHHPTSSLGRYSTSHENNHTASSSTAGSNSTSGTATGSLTDPSTGGSGLLSVGAASGSIPGAGSSGALASAGNSGVLSRINERVDDQGRIDTGSQRE